MERTWGVYRMTDRTEEVDLDAVCGMLARSYWAAERSRETIEESIRNSVCLSVFHGGNQIAFLRAVTDQATFTWICDVFVDEAYRGQGIGKRLVACAVEHPKLAGTNFSLATRDAHGLYEQYGFERREAMIRRKNQSASIGRSGL